MLLEWSNDGDPQKSTKKKNEICWAESTEDDACEAQTVFQEPAENATSTEPVQETRGSFTRLDRRVFDTQIGVGVCIIEAGLQFQEVKGAGLYV